MNETVKSFLRGFAPNPAGAPPRTPLRTHGASAVSPSSLPRGSGRRRSEFLANFELSRVSALLRSRSDRRGFSDLRTPCPRLSRIKIAICVLVWGQGRAASGPAIEWVWVCATSWSYVVCGVRLFRYMTTCAAVGRPWVLGAQGGAWWVHAAGHAWRHARAPSVAGVSCETKCESKLSRIRNPESGAAGVCLTSSMVTGSL